MKNQKKKIIKKKDEGMDSEKFNTALKHLLKSPPIKKSDLKKEKQKK